MHAIDFDDEFIMNSLFECVRKSFTTLFNEEKKIPRKMPVSTHCTFIDVIAIIRVNINEALPLVILAGIIILRLFHTTHMLIR